MKAVLRRSISLATACALALTPPVILAGPDQSRGNGKGPPAVVGPPAHANHQRNIPAHDANTLLVKMKPGRAGRLNGHGIASSRSFKVPPGLEKHDIARWRVVRLNGNQSPREVRARLLKNPNVEQVEFDFNLNANLLPDDPDFPELWGLDNQGQTGGTADADIDAPEAWDIEVGDPGVVVGVIDTGVDTGHPDLAGQIWINPDEVPDGTDTDGNGYVDDINGWDFVNNDADPYDDHGHGTHVAGTIAAATNNGVGIAGVAWDARIMALKFLSSSGSGSTSDAVSAVLYATAEGADITNNSWGGGGYSQALRDAIEASNSVFVAAAGNSSVDTDVSPHYPSSYDLPNIVSVASTDHNDALSSFSNYGAASVDLAAPGSDVYSLAPGGGYQTFSGTSMATPHVSGVAALILAQFPGMAPPMVRERLIGTAESLPSLDGLVLSGGRLNALNALDPDTTAPASITDLALDAAGVNSLDLSWTGTGDDGMTGQASAYIVYYAQQPIDASNLDQAVSQEVPSTGPAGTLEQVSLAPLAPDTTYHVRIAAIDDVGNASALSNEVMGATDTGHVSFSDDFESGLQWTIAGTDGNSGPALWHLGTHRTVSGAYALYYGQDSTLDYDTGAANVGTATMDGITVPESGFLRFTHYLETESLSPYDEATVEVSTGDGIWDVLWMRHGSTAGLESELVDLSAYAGEQISLRFGFDTKDSVANTYEGWVIDDVMIGGDEPETIAPASIDDLGASKGAVGSTDLSWTAPGDDGMTGTASVYELRYAAQPIDDGNFDAATPVSGLPSPSPAGTLEQHTIPAGTIPAGDWYLAIRAVDESGNAGAVTGSVPINVDPVYSVRVFEDTFDTPFATQWTFAGSGGASGNGLWAVDDHRVASPQYALYYGIPSQLDYNTGSTNSGTATSPQIDLTGKTGATLGFSDFRMTEGGSTYDVSLVEVNDGSGWETVMIADYLSSGSSLASREVDLSTYEGEIIRVRFSFDTVDSVANAYEGWVIDDVVVTAWSANRPPEAVVTGPTETEKDVEVTFDASGSSDPDGDAISYSWTVDGQAVAETGPQLTTAFFGTGTHYVQVTVSDGVDSATATHAVSVSNQAPIASIDVPATVLRGDVVTLDASGSTDPDGEPLTHVWSVDGTVIGTGAIIEHVFEEPGTYSVEVLVDDGTDYDTATASIIVENQAPSAVLTGPDSGVRGATLTFDASGSTDPEGDLLSYAWTVDGESAGTGASIGLSFDTVGSHTVEVVVSDGYGGTATASHTVLIENRAPVATISGPVAGNRIDPLTFDASGSSDPDGDPLTHVWSIDGTVIGTGAILEHVFDEPGTYSVEVLVDDGTDYDTATASIVVENQVPSAVLTGPDSGVRGATLTFDASGSTDPEGDLLSYAWTVDGESAGTGASIGLSFDTVGSHTVAVVVSDGYGGTATASHTVLIENRAPVATISGPVAGNRIDPLTFDASGSSDPDGDSLSYEWRIDGQVVGTSEVLTHTFGTLGTHEVSLIVDDGLNGTDSTVHTVVIENLSPAAAAGPDQEVPRKSTVTLDGSGSSDPDGSIVSYSWQQLSGTPVELAAGDTPTPYFQAPKLHGSNSETLVFELTVEDDDGATDVDSVTVIVQKFL